MTKIFPVIENTSRLYFYALFCTLAMLVAIFRWIVLKDFAFKYVDSDQAIMWSAAVDFSKGIFHEPRFYGQNYNSTLEGLLAVPLLLFTVPVYKALPITTSLIALFPFFLVSIICMFKNQKTEALLVISLPLFLPNEYDFLTSMPRGFVTGIFISSLGWMVLFFQNKSWSFFVFGFFCVIGYSLNQNAFLLSAPFFVYLFIKNFHLRHFYINVFLGGALGGVIHFLANYFYVVNANYNFRPAPSFSFSFKTLTSSFQDLDKHFNFVSPLFWTCGWIIFVVLGVSILYFLKNKQVAFALSISVFVFCTLASLGLDKIHDGTDSVFFSYSRMFLAFPIGLAFFIPLLKIKNRALGLGFSILSVAFFGVKLNLLAGSINTNVDHKRIHIVSVDPLSFVINECQKINYYSKEHNTDLIIVYSHGYYDFIDFGCSACLDSFPKTLRPEYERRTWRLIEDKDTVYRNIIIIDEHQDIADRLKRLTEKSVCYLNINGYYIISNNSLSTMELLNCLNIPVRNF